MSQAGGAPTGAAAAGPARPSAARLALGWLAIAGTLPYLTLKIVWLSGGTLGLADPALLADPSIIVLNAVTLGLDLAAVALALALTYPWGRRLPGWAVLLPLWIGTGFLVPIALAILPATLLSRAAAPAADGSGLGLEPWVQPVVYGGFTWQAVFLLAAFVLYARDRWSTAVTTAHEAAPGVRPLLRVLTVGGVALAGLSAALQLAAGAGAADAAPFAVAAVYAALAVAGAIGVLALTRARTAHRWAATVAAWVGTAAMFSWGLYTAALVLGDTALGSVGSPAGGLAQLCGLLGGFALAVAGLLALLR